MATTTMFFRALSSLSLAGRLAASAAGGCSDMCFEDSSSLLQMSAIQAQQRPPSDSHVSGRMRWRQVLKNYADTEYTAEVRLGGQTMRAVVDTGSSELLVFSKRCTSESCSGSGSSRLFYDKERSQSFHSRNWTQMHSFGSGDCISNLATEDVTFGPLTSHGQAFWEVTDASMTSLAEGSFQAILGLGPPGDPLDEMRAYVGEDETLVAECNGSRLPCPKLASLSQQAERDREFLRVTQQSPPPLGALGIERFSVCFGRAPGSDGLLTWNDDDPRRLPHGPFHSVSMIRTSSTWSAPLTSVSVSGGVVGTKIDLGCGAIGRPPCIGLLDTATSLLAIPSAAHSVLLQGLRGLRPNCENLGDMPSLALSFGGVDLVLPPEAYIGQARGPVPREMAHLFPHLAKSDLEEEEEAAAGGDAAGAKTQRRATSNCTLLVMAMDVKSEEGEAWILGAPFFRHYYSTFEVGAREGSVVHVAPANDRCDHPASVNASSSGSGSGIPVRRLLDLSRVRVPPWLRRSYARRVELGG